MGTGFGLLECVENQTIDHCKCSFQQPITGISKTKHPGWAMFGETKCWCNASAWNSTRPIWHHHPLQFSLADMESAGSPDHRDGLLVVNV